MINLLQIAGNTRAKSPCVQTLNTVLLALTGRRMLEEPQVPSFLLPIIEVFSVVIVVKLIATGGKAQWNIVTVQNKCHTMLFIT